MYTAHELQMLPVIHESLLLLNVELKKIVLFEQIFTQRLPF